MSSELVGKEVKIYFKDEKDNLTVEEGTIQEQSTFTTIRTKGTNGVLIAIPTNRIVKMEVANYKWQI